MNQDSKIYVSGHSGMFGKALMKALRAQGYDNLLTVAHSELDLANENAVRDFFAQEKPDYVFHLAAKTGGIIPNIEHPLDYLTENMRIAFNVMQAAQKRKVKGLAYVASVHIYPHNLERPMREDDFMQGEPPNAFTGYAMAKRCGVIFCEKAAQQYGSHFVAASFPNIYGMGDFGSTAIPMLLDKFADAKLENRPEVEIWGTGNAMREFLHARDAADSLIFLMQHAESGKHYNVGSGVEYSIREIAEILKDISGYTGDLVFDALKPEGARRRFLDSGKINGLGWKPKVAFREGVSEAYEEHFLARKKEHEQKQ